MAPVSDVPSWLRARAGLVSAATVLVLAATFGAQLVEISEVTYEMLPLAAIYLSAAALGFDAAVRGVRKRVGVGPSIANLAPGGWAIFAAMIWIVAVPAYFVGARRKARIEDGEPREPMTWHSWAAIAAFALLGAAVACAPFASR